MKPEAYNNTQANDCEIIEFQLRHATANEIPNLVHYGIDVSHVREIIKVPATTQYPNAHHSVLGIFNLREHIIPLVDLGEWLGVKTAAPLAEKRVIVTQFGEGFHGFLVDTVNRIYQIDRERMEPSCHFQQVTERDCVLSVVRMDGRLILMLDFEAIIRDIGIGPRIQRELAEQELLVSS